MREAGFGNSQPPAKPAVSGQIAYVEAALKLIACVFTLMITAFLGALLLWLAPGLRVDEQDLNPHLSAESVAAIRQFPASEASLPIFYFKFMRGLLRGDLGVSHTFRRP